MSDIDIPDGMALTCRTCGWRPDIGLPMGLVAAHFESEHNTDDVQLELVVLCPRCDKPMTYTLSLWNRDVFDCTPCHRTRTIRRTT